MVEIKTRHTMAGESPSFKGLGRYNGIVILGREGTSFPYERHLARVRVTIMLLRVNVLEVVFLSSS